MSHAAILEQMRRRITPESYEEIRSLWKKHSIAEDARDIAGLMSTLTEDCVYELPQTGHSWHGHEGATRFYLSLLEAFPDVHFDLQQIVIGPQGVFEEAHATATHKGQWLDRAPTGQAVAFEVLIQFPWDAERRRFKGERVYFFWDLGS
ncbi:MAG: ester cyclase [FCB group bacterium]|jgi:predicted ester cyclase|nr:ester cyclase [FCB group bacterium]